MIENTKFWGHELTLKLLAFILEIVKMNLVSDLQERGKSGKGSGPRQQARGIDFYFSSAKQQGYKK